MPERRALITGITGQDGSYLAERLLAEGTEVHGLVRAGEGVALGAWTSSPGLTLHVRDLADLAPLADLVARVAPDEIYNLAGVSSVALSWRDPVRAALLNGVAAASMFDAALRFQDESGRPVHFVQASSAEIFGAPRELPQNELTPIAPTNPYGASKAFAHHMGAIYRARGLPVSSLILYPHESPRRPADFVTRKITQSAARIARDGVGEIVLGNVHAKRDWGWAPDYVDAMIRAARLDVGHDLIVASGESHSVAEFVRLALARVGISDWERWVRVDPALMRPTDAKELVGDASEARRLLGWVPKVEFETIVEHMMDHDIALLPGRAAV